MSAHRPPPRNLSLAFAAGLVASSLSGIAHPAAAPSPCAQTEYRPAPGVAALASRDGGITLLWQGDAGQELRLRLVREGGTPVIDELSVRRRAGRWVSLARHVTPEFRVTSGLRRITQQQVRPLERLHVPITPDLIDREKWNAFWDAPLFVEGSGERPASHPTSIPFEKAGPFGPGLPRKPEEVRRATATYVDEGCSLRSDGARLEVQLSGVRLGVFSGHLLLTVYRGSNLIRLAVVAKTDEPGVAYKYDAGLKGLALGGATRVVWRDLARNVQSYGFGPPHERPVAVKSAHRMIAAEVDGGAIAAFPPPHSFYWARETEEVLANGWYRRDDQATFSFGVRQAEREEDPEYLHNFALVNARPGTWQRMPIFFYPTIGRGEDALDRALRFTRGDRFKPLAGYKVMGAHYHAGLVDRLRKAGGLDAARLDFDAIKAAGIDIYAPIDGAREAPPGAESRLRTLAAYYEVARLHSDKSFVIMPNEEVNQYLGGHSDVLISKPVFWLFQRKPGQPLTESHPTHGRVYNVGSADDFMEMAERENALVFMPHPRTKGSTGYPDAIKDTPHFRHARYRGAGFRWGMGIDGSETRLCELRCLSLFDEMNNWVADLAEPKYLQAIAETRSDIGHRGRQPYDDVYGMSPVNYVRMDDLPGGADWTPIIEAMRRGDFFVTSGEVLVPSFRVEGSGPKRVVVATVEWTFPLEFVEVVTGDGRSVNRRIVPTPELGAFGRKQFRIEVAAVGQKWARFAAWDTAGNGAFVQPVRLRD